MREVDNCNGADSDFNICAATVIVESTTLYSTPPHRTAASWRLVSCDESPLFGRHLTHLHHSGNSFLRTRVVVLR